MTLMKSNVCNSVLLLFLLASACDVPGSSVPTTGFGGSGGQQYYSAEVRIYNSEHSCPTWPTLNDLTTTLREQMATQGWWPLENSDLSQDCDPASTSPLEHCPIMTDFVDNGYFFGANHPLYPGLSGEDQIYADSTAFTFFAGHGQQGVLAYRRPATYGQNNNLGVCAANWDDDVVSLGLGGGSKTRVAAFAASCFGFMPDSLSQLPGTSYEIERVFGASTTWQHLVFFDSPNISDSSMGSFIQCLAQPVGDNWSCWTGGALYNDPASNTEHNEPVVYTNAAQDESPDTRQQRAENANLLTLEHLPSTRLSTFAQTFQFSSAVDLGDPFIDSLEFDPLCVDLINEG